MRCVSSISKPYQGRGWFEVAPWLIGGIFVDDSRLGVYWFCSPIAPVLLPFWLQLR